MDGAGLERCNALVAAYVGGDHQAWRALAEVLWPEWRALVSRSRSMDPLRRSTEHVDNVVARVVEKLGARDGRVLALYHAWQQRHPAKTFADWNRIFVRNVVRDCCRRVLGGGRQAGSSGTPSPKRLLNEFALSLPPEGPGVRPPLTLEQTARELVDFARAHLPAEQLDALGGWLEGGDFDEVATALDLATADDARRLVRAAVATLRRRFAALGAGPASSPASSLRGAHVPNGDRASAAGSHRSAAAGRRRRTR